jgi:uncharacterized protein YneR
MQITVTNAAFQWFKDEFDLKKGAAVRFFARYGGNSTIQAGFSLGVILDVPSDPVSKTEKEGINFFVEDKDEWYFDGCDLKVVLDENTNEIDFQYV